MAKVDLIHGDMLAELPKLVAAGVRFHSVCCDPPYHFGSIVKRFAGASSGLNRPGKGEGAYRRHAQGFMGKKWDAGDIAFRPETWALVGSVMLPGAHLVAFAGTKGAHRMACAIEDAGFEIRDTLAWLYGSGFPKSHNQKGEWEGWGTALKPAYEPIVIARWPMAEKTVAGNLAEHRCGAININSCRVGWAGTEDAAAAAAAVRFADSRARGTARQSQSIGKESRDGTNHYDPNAIKGRWPANVVHDGSEEVLAAFPDTGTGGFPASRGAGGIGNNGHRGQSGLMPSATDAGSAARFFYSAKADATDRLESKHPTVKPVDLMRWLVRLVTPKGGRVLDPFAGSGTTGMACMAEGFDCTLIERETEYVADIRRRLAHVHGTDTPLFSGG